MMLYGFHTHVFRLIKVAETGTAVFWSYACDCGLSLDNASHPHAKEDSS